MYTIIHTIFDLPDCKSMHTQRHPQCMPQQGGLAASCKSMYNSCFSFRYYIKNEALLQEGKAG